MVHIWVINEHASSHSRLKSYVQKGLQLPALLYITEDADKRGLQVQQIEHSALNQSVQDELIAASLHLSTTSVSRPIESASVESSGSGAIKDVDMSSSMRPPQVESEASHLTHFVPMAESDPPQPLRVSATALHEELSVRELQTLMLLGQGLSVSGIARNLALSVKTISTYRARALEKLKLNTTADLIRYAVEHLLLPGSGELSNRSID